MHKFKVGDSVKIEKIRSFISKKYHGKISKVTKVVKSGRVYGDIITLECDRTDSGCWADELTLTSAADTSAEAKTLTLPVDSNARKEYPLFRGVLRYFPAALAGIAKISKLGNDKHNPGEEMHHARGKSSDQGDCIMRHLVDVEDLLAAQARGENITQEQILNEVNQMAWRALAFSQELHEKFGAPLAPGAKK